MNPNGCVWALFERDEGKRMSGSGDYVLVWEGAGYFFVTLLLFCLVSSFHCWYSCQRLRSEVETSLGSSSSSSVRSIKSEYFLLSLGDSRPIKASQASSYNDRGSASAM